MDHSRLNVATALLWASPPDERTFLLSHLNRIYGGYLNCKYRNYIYDVDAHDFVWRPRLRADIVVAGTNSILCERLMRLCKLIEHWGSLHTRKELASYLLSGGHPQAQPYNLLYSAPKKEWQYWDGYRLCPLPPTTTMIMYPIPLLRLACSSEEVRQTVQQLYLAVEALYSHHEYHQLPHQRDDVAYEILKVLLWQLDPAEVDHIFNDLQGGATSSRLLKVEQYARLGEAYAVMARALGSS